MNKSVVLENDDVEKDIQSALSKHPEVIIDLDEGTPVYRVQPTCHEDPFFYNPDSDSRYGDKNREIGVCYVACSSEVAIAETFQHGPNGQGTPVLIKEIEERSLYPLKTARVLKMIDVARLSAYTGNKLRDIVKVKGQGSEGYSLTQTLSAVCMRHSDEIDGLVYTSTVLPSVSRDECNLALFGGRATQLVSDGKASPLMEVVLENGQTAVEFLDSLKVTVE